jgi:molybdopterin molybdotransferase
VPDQLISIDEARRVVLGHVTGPPPSETVPVQQSLDRVLAEDLCAEHDTPPFPGSAMDGYALAAPDHEAPQAELTVVGEARAGRPYLGSLQPGQTIRISTGAQVPDSAVAVIRQEDVTLGAPGTVSTHGAVPAGNNIRRAGEDMARGALVLAAGTRLGPAHLGAAIAAGAGAVRVAVRPRVSVVCTGDELQPPGAPLQPGQIHNSNGPMLAALAMRASAVVVSRPPLPDDLERTKRELAEALETAEVLIISGGVSVGPHDHVKPALQALGVDQHFWGVALQPGKPTWFGTRHTKLVFALPGNPVSTAVTFGLFVRPALDALQGAPPGSAPAGFAELTVPVKPNPSREQAIRVRLATREGRLTAAPTGAQDSHRISSLIDADALAIIPAGGPDPLEAGTAVRLLPAPG